jgi:DNA-binding MarR family transcriptional regulator
MGNAARPQRSRSSPSAGRKTAIVRTAKARPQSVALGGLGDHLGYALKRAQLRLFEHFLQSVAPLKLTPAQFSVLTVVDANPGRNQTEIAATLGILGPNFVALLDALEHRGLCRRSRAAADRRSHVLALTEKGRATLAEARRLVASHHEKRLNAVLSAGDRAHLVEMLETIACEL